MKRHLSLFTIALGLGLATPATAQFGNAWVEFVRNDGSLQNELEGISSTQTEVDFAWGDFDKDGWTDLAVVRKQVFTSAGKRTNYLLMNEHGVLKNRTAQYASASDVPGDQGFLTPTNDRDVFVVDVDMDGWDDLVTATTISDGDPKSIGHPRIYMNLGNDGSGDWQGFEYQEARIPQMVVFSTGQPQNPRFCSVTAGDVTGDDAPDLYFGDYDSSGAGGSGQPSGLDFNNRLLINDGNGYFTDESQSRMNATMLLSAFGAASVIADLNGDGANDVLKQTALNPPQHVAVVYNNPANEGMFNIYHDFTVGAPYHVNTGDMNNDGRIDLVISDDGSDRYRYNMGNDGLGRVIWGSSKTFQFLTGGDDGFGSNNIITDLDGDGWADVVICDVDVDIGGFNRRVHIYHNPGGAVGSEITLREERQSSGSGWIGAVGFTANDLQGGHDVAPFDLDNDGDNDMVLARGAGMFVWLNKTVDNLLVQDNPEISLAAGGSQNLIIDGREDIGGDVFFMLGSATGTSPGLPAGSFTLPLVPDFWFNFMLTNPNTIVANSLGVLSPSGDATATLTLPAGMDPGLAGLDLFHAFVAFDAFGNVEAASNAVPVSFIP